MYITRPVYSAVLINEEQAEQRDMLIDQTFKLHFMEMSGNHHHHHQQHQLLQQHVEVDHHMNKVDTSMPARLDLVIKTSEYLAKRDKVKAEGASLTLA